MGQCRGRNGERSFGNEKNEERMKKEAPKTMRDRENDTPRNGKRRYKKQSEGRGRSQNRAREGKGKYNHEGKEGQIVDQLRTVLAVRGQRLSIVGSGTVTRYPCGPSPNVSALIRGGGKRS